MKVLFLEKGCLLKLSQRFFFRSEHGYQGILLPLSNTLSRKYVSRKQSPIFALDTSPPLCSTFPEDRSPSIPEAPNA